MGKEFKTPSQIIYVCTGSKCGKRGGKEISKLFKSHIKDNGLKNEIEVIKTDCTDRCKFAPVMCFQPQNKWYHQLSLPEAMKAFEEETGEKKLG
ncbi:(2Fe-2S) ferredoxin domain-containing protein [Cytophagaceae bacterium ABcell3]|nr:(2Fe-2S) ferredoxin domain-containing protein [Cytophagaceae bacterium ABcell3]